MQAARRLYLYVMSGITLGVVAWGMVLLARVALRDLLPGPSYGGDPYAEDPYFYDNSREQLSQAIAMLGVGAPVWAIHWWLVHRGLRASNPDRDAERGSALRAAYFTLVLFVTIVLWVPGAIDVIGWVVVGLLNARPEYDYTDPLGAGTLAIVAFAVWLFHGLVRRSDLAAGHVEGAAAWLPRLYLYGVAIGALFAALQSVQTIAASLLFAGTSLDDTWQVDFLVNQGLQAIGWGLVWYGHWFYAGRLAAQPEGRGADERVSRMRVAAFVGVIVGAAALALRNVAGMIESVIGPAMTPPVDETFGYSFTPLGAAAIAAVLYGVTWFLHARALEREPAAVDPLRALHQARLVGHGIAAATLLMGGVGAAWVAGHVLKVLLGGSLDDGGYDFAVYQLPMWLSTMVVGLAAWFVVWRGVVARRRLDPVGEATSTIRRTFLYITIATSLIAAIAAAAVILYRLSGILLDTQVGGSLANELSTPLGVLVVAALSIVYHGLALRADQRVAAEVAPAAAAGSTAAPDVAAAPDSADASPPDSADASPVAAATPVHATLTLRGPAGADMTAAIAALRAALPEGMELAIDEDG